MKIALDVRSLRVKGGGISLRIHKVVEHLLQNTDATLVLFCSEGLDVSALDFGVPLESRATFVPLNADGMGPSETSYQVDMEVIPALLEDHQVDLFHATANWGISSPAIRVPTVLTVHDVIPFFIREGVMENDEHFAFYEKLIASSVKHATHIISVSQYSKDATCEKLGVPPDKVTVVHNGMDRDARPEDYKGKGGPLLSKLGLKEEQYLIYIGGFYERKNVMRLVDAFRTFLDVYPDYQLVVTGDSQSGDYVKKRFAMFQEASADIQDHICSPGYISREELNMLVANAMALLYPSISEGFGIPILEAMALDVPALCSDNTVLPEIGGDAAIYFDPFDVSAMAKAMIDVVAKPELRQAKIALGRTQARLYGWCKTCEQVVGVYKQVLGGAA